jgi:ribonuclease VapC
MREESLVLDSFALLSVFLQEPAGPRVVELLETSGDERVAMPVVNLGEVLYRLQIVGSSITTAQALQRVHAWPIVLRDIDEELALAAAEVKAERRMGYLDCFVVALAQRLDATILTGDPDFQRADGLVKIEWLQR